MTEEKPETKIGERMPDGSVYAGTSPDSGEAMYATPDDAPVTGTFNDAAEYTRQLNAERFLGQDDWRVPTKGELEVLFNNRAAIGGFDAGSYPKGCYWSSSQYDKESLWNQWFYNGTQSVYGKEFHSSLRCVRGGLATARSIRS